MRLSAPSFRRWSAVFASFLAAESHAGVVLNEIFYHPKDPARPTEFIELYNPGTEAVALGGWKLSSGVAYTFPAGAVVVAGGYVVVARQPEEFQKEFHTQPLGPWIGHLSHTGEKVVLSDAEGHRVDEVKYDTGFPWPTGAAGAGASLELLHPALDRRAGSSWRSSKGPPTPGARNSVAVDRPPPVITEVTHRPAAPRGGEPVTVAVRISSPAALRAVTLWYQLVEPGQYLRRTDAEYAQRWTAAPMTLTEPGRYEATLPAALQRNRCLLRYRIRAEDVAGGKAGAPYDDDAAPNFAWYTADPLPAWSGASQPGQTPVLTFPPSLMSALPALTLLATREDAEHSQWDAGWNKRPLLGTIVCGGKVYDHIVFHNRGQGSVYVAGKNKWGFHFDHGEAFQPPPSWGRPFARPWHSLSLNACASPWVPSNRGMAGLDEAVSFRAYELAGVPASRTVPVQLRVVATEAEAVPGKQYAGDLRGLYLMVEDPDGAFLATHGLSDGTIFRAGNGARKHVDSSAPAAPNAYEQLMAGIRAKPTEEWWRAHLDLPAFYSFHALNRLLGNVDLREGDNHYLLHRADGRWTVLPWDLDMMFIPKSHQSGTVEEDHCLEQPALRREYQNRCREILDLLCADATPRGGQFGQLVQEYAALLHPPGEPLGWPELDCARWNYAPHINEGGRYFANPATGDPDHNWQRVLATADFAGFARFVTDFCTAARPAEHPWQLDDGEPRGYGYGYLVHEAADDAVPERPVLTAAGGARHFHCSAYAGREPFAAQQWRLGRIDSGHYEIDHAWTSAELPGFAEDFTFPKTAAAPGQVYRARARMRDAAGRWSHWSAAIEFVEPAAK